MLKNLTNIVAVPVKEAREVNGTVRLFDRFEIRATATDGTVYSHKTRHERLDRAERACRTVERDGAMIDVSRGFWLELTALKAV